MTPRYLLDTSIVSSPVSRTPHPEIVKRLEARGHECAIAAPVWHELTYGCSRLPLKELDVENWSVPHREFLSVLRRPPAGRMSHSDNEYWT